MDPGAHKGSESPYLVSPAYDRIWFLGPGILALVWGALLGLATDHPQPVRTGMWILCVVLVDVAHVYATAFRTYLDPQARRRHGRRLVVVPILCLWTAFVLYLASPLAFYRVLAYVAVFHFIQQHVGFALLYGRKEGASPSMRRWIRAAVWAGTAGPILYWHATTPRTIAWFVDGDFLPLSAPGLAVFAVAASAAVVALYVVRRAVAHARGQARFLVDAMVLLPAANWHMGIVWFDDDRIFTVTNVLFHGIPYMALVYATGGRRTLVRRMPRLAGTAAAAGLVFYVLLAQVALFEEALWDVFVHHDRPALFGSGFAITDPALVALAAALLSVPQTTHYVLDRWIWRVGPKNPDLAADLGLGAPAAPASAVPTTAPATPRARPATSFALRGRA